MAAQRTDFGGEFYVDVTWDAPSITASTTVDTDVTVPGILAGDVALNLIPPAALNAGLGVASVRVKAVNTITVRLMNATAGALDPASGTWRFVIGRP